MMIDGVHYLITRDGSQKERNCFNDCRQPPYPGRRRVQPLIIPSGRRNKDEMEGNVSITCFCAERPPRAHFGAPALAKRNALSLAGFSWEEGIGLILRADVLRLRDVPLPRGTWRVAFVKVHVDSDKHEEHASCGSSRKQNTWWRRLSAKRKRKGNLRKTLRLRF